MLATGARLPLVACLWRRGSRCRLYHIYVICSLQYTVTSAALSFYKYSEWVAVVTAFATAAASYLDFNGYVKKLDSYTSTVRALDSHLSWWHSLSETARAGTSATYRLVEMGEQCILATRFSRNLVLRENVEDIELEGDTSGKAAAESEPQAS